MTNEPILKGFEFHHVVLRIGTGQGEEHDLPGWAVVGAQAWIHALRQSDLLQPVDNFLTSIQSGDLVVVNDGDYRESRQRHRAQMGHMRHAIQLNFERDCDLLFHFLGRVSRPLGDDLGVGVRDIRDMPRWADCGMKRRPR